MIKVAIVEDEKSGREVLTECLSRYEKERGVKFDVACYGDALTFLDKYKHDREIVFMDIELPNIDGMEAARRLRKIDGSVVIIFVTNMAQFAVKGYEVDALDFTVKPVSYANLSMKIDKAVRVIGMSKQYMIGINCPGNVVRVDVRALSYIEVIGHKLYYHTDDGVVEGRGSISEEEKRFGEFAFLRCNNCYLVNPAHIRSVTNSEVLMLDGSVLAVSHTKRKKFLADFAAYLGYT